MEPGGRDNAGPDQLPQAEFKKKMAAHLQSTGVVGAVKSQLRAQLLSQLQRGQIVQLGPPPGDKPSLKRHALNSMVADYFFAVQYNYSLSVFKEESGTDARPVLSEDEVIDVLKLDRETSFYQAYLKAKAHGGPDSCVIMNLLDALAEAAAVKGKESFTQTVGGDRYQLEVRMKQLEDDYQAKLRAARMGPNAGLEERLALYRQEIEEQAKAEVGRQVERVRELEVSAARLDEAAKARRQLEAERLELDRLHAERLGKLRGREEELMDKLRRQQRDVENVAYEHRQRILREEERLRNWRTEIGQGQDSRQEQLKQLERSLELRERAVASREAAAEKRLAEATESIAAAQVQARQDAEREYMELKSSLTQQRMQLEVDRSRILELRSEATAEIAAARAKEDRLRALETARAEAEARAAAHAADAEVCRLQMEKLGLELSTARDELSRRIVSASDTADAMLNNAAGAMNMLQAEAVASRSVNVHFKEAVAQVSELKEQLVTVQHINTQLQQERSGLQLALSSASNEAELLRQKLDQLEAIADEAIADRGRLLQRIEDANFKAFQHERELAEMRSSLSRTREELAALKVQLVVRGGGRPGSRGFDSPTGRRGALISPPRRPITAVSLSNLSLAMAMGGGGMQQHQHAAGGFGGMAGHMAAAHQAGSVLSGPEPGGAMLGPDPVLSRLERLQRHEDILASQEDAFKRHMASMQDARDRSLSVLGHMAAVGSIHQQQQQQQQLYNQQQQQQQQQHLFAQQQQQFQAPLFPDPQATYPGFFAQQQQPQYALQQQASQPYGQQPYAQVSVPAAGALLPPQAYPPVQLYQPPRSQSPNDLPGQDQQQQAVRPTGFTDGVRPGFGGLNPGGGSAAVDSSQQAAADDAFGPGQAIPFLTVVGLGSTEQQLAQPTAAAPAGLAGVRVAPQPVAVAAAPAPQQVAAQPAARPLSPPPVAPVAAASAPPGLVLASNLGGGGTASSAPAPAAPPPGLVIVGAKAASPASRSPKSPKSPRSPKSPTAPPLSPRGGSSSAAAAPAAAPAPAQAAPEPPLPPPRPSIPGLVIVKDFGAGQSGPTPAPTPAAAKKEEPPPPPPPAPVAAADVGSALQAKMRMLQEQREKALAEARAQQERREREREEAERAADAQRHAEADSRRPQRSGSSSSSRQRRPSSTDGGVTGEEDDVVRPLGAGLPGSQSLRQRAGAAASRQLESVRSAGSSSSRKGDGPMARPGVPAARSENSSVSLDVPPAAGLGGQHSRQNSIMQTLDDIPSSLMGGYELPGLNDDDGDDGAYGGGGFEVAGGDLSDGSVF